MDGEFVSDEEIEAYEKKNDPARRSMVRSVAAVAAVFLFVGGAYAVGYSDVGDGALSASLEETFPLRDEGRSEENSDGRASETSEDVGTVCGYESSGAPNHGAVFISEVAWMGTEEGAQYEWFEIANTGIAVANIGGWSVVDKDEQIRFAFPAGAEVPAAGFYLLARSADRVGSAKADHRYAGNLKNENEGLRLFDAQCVMADEARAAPKWPAGETGERRTMERNLATRAWYTSSVIGGTPKAVNSSPPVRISTPAAPSASSVTPTSSAVRAAPPQGNIGVSEVMAGKEGASNWDFVELYNAGTSAVNLTGWSVKKKVLSSGNESALVAANRLEGVTVPAGGRLLLAHPEYAGTPAADVTWPKSYTLAYTNNAVVLYDADGAKVDEISWMEIPKGQSYAEVNGVWILGTPTPRAAP